MSTPATTASPAAPQRPAGPAARSGAPPGETPFAAFLENDRARTAPAEGPKSDTPRETRPADRGPRDDAGRPVDDRHEPSCGRDDAPVADEAPAETPVPATDPALASPAPVDVPVAEVAPVVATPVVLTPETLPAPAATTPAAATPVAPVPVVAAEPQAAVPAVPAVKVEQTTAPVPLEPALAPAPATDAGAADAAPAGTTAKPAAALTGEGEQPAGDQAGNRQGGAAAREPVQQAASQTRAGAHTDRRPVTAAQAPATAEPVKPATEARATEALSSAAAQSGSSATPSTQVRGAVPLEHAHRTVEAALQLAAQRSGVTRARLHLHPAELGAIEIHLRHSATGITARLVAESPEALTLLQQNAGDLRRSLEDAGIDVLGLDVGAQSEDRRADQGAFAGAMGEHGGRGTGADGGDEAEAEAATTVTIPTVRARLPLPGGALLDVLA